jgi:hypothetical protein
MTDYSYQQDARAADFTLDGGVFICASCRHQERVIREDTPSSGRWR